MTDLLIGTNNPSSIKLGDTNIAKVMLGDVQVWPRIPSVNSYIEISPAGRMYVSAILGSDTLDLTSNYDSLAINSSEPWCIVSLSQNHDNATILVEWYDNNTDEDRETWIEITHGTGGDRIGYFPVYQYA